MNECLIVSPLNPADTFAITPDVIFAFKSLRVAIYVFFPLESVILSSIFHFSFLDILRLYSASSKLFSSSELLLGFLISPNTYRLLSLFDLCSSISLFLSSLIAPKAMIISVGLSLYILLMSVKSKLCNAFSVTSLEISSLLPKACAISSVFVYRLSPELFSPVLIK